MLPNRLDQDKIDKLLLKIVNDWDSIDNHPNCHIIQIIVFFSYGNKTEFSFLTVIAFVYSFYIATSGQQLVSNYCAIYVLRDDFDWYGTWCEKVKVKSNR